jgi:hypothetical protein
VRHRQRNVEGVRGIHRPGDAMAVRLEKLKARRTIYRALQFFEQVLLSSTNDVDEALRELLSNDQLALLVEPDIPE